MPAASVLRYIRLCFMDNKYQISKSKEPETKQEMIQHQIEELVKRRDKESDLKAKQVINAEITKLFAQYHRLKL
jgi:molybdenum cofactor biosynthesis enzyme MoaA